MLKESFAGFWQQKGRWHAAGYFSKWYSRAIRSRLEPVKKTAKCLKNHLGGLLNYFLHPITNAVTEGLNSRIQEIKANARGFRWFFCSFRVKFMRLTKQQSPRPRAIALRYACSRSNPA